MGDAAVTSQVFWTLKSMVKAWYIDKVRNKSEFSNVLADGFWRWLSSDVGKGRSCLYEPALAKFVRALMRKTLLQLLAECKRMGASIVYASFSRLFVLTSKPTAGSAAAFGQYLVSALTSRDLFKHIDLQIVHHWDYLLWMDVANFGGVISKATVEQNGQDDTDDGAYTVDMHWNIATFLPDIAREKFNLIVGGFLRRMYEAKRSALQASDSLDRTPLTAIRINNALQAGGELGEPKSSATEGEGNKQGQENAYTEAAKQLMTKWLTRKMLLQVQELRDQHARQLDALDEMDGEMSSEWLWPDLPGGCMSVNDEGRPRLPALEFVKLTMAVMALHRDCALEVGICRRNALQLLGHGEFGPEMEFKQPCESLSPSPNVVCVLCNEERTLDLCRDADLLDAARQREPWRCSRCHNPYDRSDIELRLCRMAHDAVRTFTLQDLRCSRCHVLREGNVGLTCPCSGTWGLTLPRRDTMKKLNLLHRIAKFHRLDVLGEAVGGILELC
jgi:DNA polymerase epsilon subunit 1